MKTMFNATKILFFVALFGFFTLLPYRAVQAVKVSTGGDTTCALRTNNRLYCWGSNQNGQIGDSTYGTTNNRMTPTQVHNMIGETDPYLPNVQDVDVGGFSSNGLPETHTCATVRRVIPVYGLRDYIHCWGSNIEGNISIGGVSNLPIPLPQIARSGLTVPAWVNAPDRLNAGSLLTCAIDVSNLKCVGDGSSGQIGNLSAPDNLSYLSTYVLAPTATAATPTIFSNVSRVSAGLVHVCAISDSGLYCWGNDWVGQLGNGATTGDQTKPVQILAKENIDPVGGVTPTPVTAVSAGSTETCAVQSGNVKCWGWNLSGTSGNNNTTQTTSPVSVSNETGSALLTNIVEVSVGTGNFHTGVTGRFNHVCARSSTNVVYCWGDNTYGQLGNGSSALSSGRPVRVIKTDNTELRATNISAGSSHSCAIEVGTGQIYCWGRNNSGQLGLGTSGDSTNVNRATAVPNFNLTSDCWDGTVVAPEQCDNGTGNLSTPPAPPTYGSPNLQYCTTSCTNATVIAPNCGDGTRQTPQEQCDTSGTANTTCDMGLDSISQRCTSAVCGDTYLNTNYIINTYNKTPGVDLHEQCETSTPGVESPTCDYREYQVYNPDTEEDETQYDKQACTPRVCGDGYTNSALLSGVPVETCDDGGSSPGNGCDATCHLEPGYSSCYYNASSAYVCVPICGDGLLRGFEICDDGNTTPNDGCSASCTQEIHYICDGPPGINNCRADCGDTFVVPGKEMCDIGRTAGALVDSVVCDMNSLAGTQQCTFYACNDGYHNTTNSACDEIGVDTTSCDWSGGTGAQACTPATCGDAYINTARGEECDAFNMTDDTNNCDFAGNVAGQACTNVSCGDGYINHSRRADGVTNWETCDIAGMNSDRESCNWDNGQSNGVSHACTTARCGDGYRNAVHIAFGTRTEQCDGGSVDTATCNYSAGNDQFACTNIRCGDGYWNHAGEACETGTNTNTCDFAGGNTPGQSCTVAACGDGYRNSSHHNDGLNGPFEECDSGNADTANCDSALAASQNGLNQRCTAPVCGDNYANHAAGEDCDDRYYFTHGNHLQECEYGDDQCDICSATCLTIDGETDFCGDEIIDTINGETCDEGALNNSPLHCNATCNGITVSICGNGLPLETGESCDDGNTYIDNCPYNQNSCLVCNRSCTGFTDGLPSFCGDSKIDATHETCDDANTKNDDGCDSTCHEEAGFTCTTVNGVSVCKFHCGNGDPSETGETCDYGVPEKTASTDPQHRNLYNGDRCMVNTYSSAGNTCTWCDVDCHVQNSLGRHCSDGTVDRTDNEICDDGNSQNGDGCSSDCLTIEPGFTCSTGTHSYCTSRCGDSLCAIGGGETCTNCPGDCGVCSIVTPNVASQHEAGVLQSIFEKVKSVFIKPQLRIAIPGLSFEEPKPTIEIPKAETQSYQPGVRTPVQIGDEYHHMTVILTDTTLGDNSPIHFTLESCPNEGTLSAGNAKDVDTDCNGTIDTRIEFKGMKDGKPELITILLHAPKKITKVETKSDEQISQMYESLLKIIQIFSKIIYI